METLSRQEREDVIHAIDQTVSFYRRKLEPSHIHFWMEALAGYGAEAIKAALANHTKTDRREPRPSDLLPFLEEQRARERSRLPTPDQVHTPAPPEIVAAWKWFMAVNAGDLLGDKPSSLSMGQKAALAVDQDTQDRYLLIVNEQARLYNMPEAIPPEYRLAEVWK